MLSQGKHIFMKNKFQGILPTILLSYLENIFSVVSDKVIYN